MKKIIVYAIIFFNMQLNAYEDLYDPDFISWCLQTKEAQAQPYSPIISLGMNCQAAYQLRIHGLRYESYPFDWLICPCNAMIALIENNFEHFLDPQYLTFIHTDTEKHILNTYYNIKFLHDFRLNESFMEDYEKVCEIYQRRIERFYQKMSESSRALLIRKKITKQEAMRLQEVLINKFSPIHFAIVAIDNSPEMKLDWNIPNVINYYMPIGAGETWKGNSILWTELFTYLNLNISLDEPNDI